MGKPLIENRKVFKTEEEFTAELKNLEKRLKEEKIIVEPASEEQSTASEEQSTASEEQSTASEEQSTARNNFKKFENIKTGTIGLIDKKNNTNVQAFKKRFITPDYANEELLVIQSNGGSDDRISLFVLMDCIDSMTEANDEKKTKIKSSIISILSENKILFRNQPPKQKEKKTVDKQSNQEKVIPHWQPSFINYSAFNPPLKKGGKRRKTHKNAKKRSRKTRNKR